MNNLIDISLTCMNIKYIKIDNKNKINMNKQIISMLKYQKIAMQTIERRKRDNNDNIESSITIN